MDAQMTRAALRRMSGSALWGLAVDRLEQERLTRRARRKRAKTPRRPGRKAKQ